jgi:hypothetical protein
MIFIFHSPYYILHPAMGRGQLLGPKIGHHVQRGAGGSGATGIDGRRAALL